MVTLKVKSTTMKNITIITILLIIMPVIHAGYWREDIDKCNA